MQRPDDRISYTKEIRFPEVLSRLIEGSPYKRNRRPIWEALNITSAALSQYMSGQSRPKFETVVALADFFGVSLDHLILGKEETKPSDESAKPFVRYVDWALAERYRQKLWIALPSDYAGTFTSIG